MPLANAAGFKPAINPVPIRQRYDAYPENIDYTRMAAVRLVPLCLPLCIDPVLTRETRFARRFPAPSVLDRRVSRPLSRWLLLISSTSCVD